MVQIMTQIMSHITAVIRIGSAALTVITGSCLVLVGSLAPIRVRRVRLANWLVIGIAHILCRIFRVRVICEDVARLRYHKGFVFPNHQSLLDPLVLLSITPLRFLSAIEVRSYPFIGWLTQSIGTVFVARQDRNSRQQARSDILSALARDPHPPIVLFPEGRLGPGHQLYPFRYGAFATAASKGIPYLLCGVRYRPLDVAVWHGGQGESLWQALWRLARFAGSIQAEVIPLTAQQPDPQDDPAQLALFAQGLMAAALAIPVETAPPPPRYAQ